MRTKMRTRWLAALALVAMLSACAPDGSPESFVIYSNTLVSKKTQCIAETGGGATTESRQIGVLDLLVANHYWMFPMVFNGLATTLETVNIGPTQMQIEAHTISIKGAWVTYEMDGLEGNYATGEATQLPKQWLPTSGSVQPTAFQTVQLEAVPPTIANLLDADAAFDRIGSAGYLTVSITIEGVMGDGTVVHTEPFHFPITVCRGCLATYEVVEKKCCQFEFTPDFMPCFPGQDERYSCLTGCWLTYRDRPDRYAEKMAMYSGFTKSLDVNLDELTLPEWFLIATTELPGEVDDEEAPAESEGQ